MLIILLQKVSFNLPSIWGHLVYDVKSSGVFVTIRGDGRMRTDSLGMHGNHRLVMTAPRTTVRKKSGLSTALVNYLLHYTVQLKRYF